MPSPPHHQTEWYICGRASNPLARGVAAAQLVAGRGAIAMLGTSLLFHADHRRGHRHYQGTRAGLVAVSFRRILGAMLGVRRGTHLPHQRQR